MVAAYFLSQEHQVTVFEANDYVGGHTNTIDVPLNNVTYPVDTGFIVYNDRTYPNFMKLLSRLGVESQASDMSFSVKCEGTGLEYNGTSLNTLFAQRRNLFKPAFYRMIRDILRFNRESTELLTEKDAKLTLGQYLEGSHYSREFINHYIIPMGAAIWSAAPGTMFEFPASYFVQFFANHGMLSVNDRPTWRVIKGGSKEYVKALTRSYRHQVHLKTRVLSVSRFPSHVELKAYREQGGSQRIQFDQVVIATHSDQALAILDHPSLREQEILGAIPYQENEAVLHTDASLLPRRRRAWASWNYHILNQHDGRVAVTYHMNRLQRLSAPREFCVTLNYSQAIDPDTIIRKITYHHPVYTPAGVAAQNRYGEINGVNRTWFCGAYWHYGFHEDGVKSALSVCEHFGKRLAA